MRYEWHTTISQIIFSINWAYMKIHCGTVCCVIKSHIWATRWLLWPPALTFTVVCPRSAAVKGTMNFYCVNPECCLTLSEHCTNKYDVRLCGWRWVSLCLCSVQCIWLHVCRVDLCIFRVNQQDHRFNSATLKCSCVTHLNPKLLWMSAFVPWWLCRLKKMKVELLPHAS